jgi:streptogramin lyase
MRTLWRLLLCLICLAPSLAAQTWRVDSNRINAWAQDSTGQVWGIGILMSPDLYRWGASGWNAIAVDGIAGNYQPSALATGPDGEVYCLWSAGEEEHIVARLQGSTSQVVAHFTGHLDKFFPSIFIDSNRNIWITESGIHIYRITPDGQAECVYTIEYDHRYEANLPKKARLNFDSVYAAEDGQGKVWFWSGRRGGGGGVPSLQGILIFDGKNFTLHSDLPDPSVKSYSTVEPDGPNYMLLGGPRGHLYRVETRTLSSEAVAEPASGAFPFVQSIYHAGRATYIVSVDGSLPVAERSGGGRIGALWRLQDGEWKRLVNGIDMRPQTLTDSTRSFLATPAGVWLGAYGAGPWFIPAGGGEPVHIDWRYGFSLDESEGLMTLPDGRLLLIAATSASMACGSIAVMPADLLAAYQPPAEVRTLNPLRVLVPDQHHHLWGFLSGDRPVISEWDGKSWTDHGLPDDFDPLRFWNFGVDTRNRIWLLSGRCAGAVTIFNPQWGNVEVYPDFSHALQAQLPNRTDFHIQGDRFAVSTITADGRIGYRDPCAQAHYFNGQSWQVWKPADIDSSQHGNFDGPAFFDHAGNFAVNLAGRTWEFTKGEEWRIASFERGLGTDRERTAPQAPAPPADCAVGNPESVTQDRLGTYWLTSHGQLYRAIPGLCLPLFSSTERQPFADSRTIKTALIDPHGNTFLETYFAAHPEIGEYVIVNAPQTQPQTTLRAIVEATGSVKLQFGTQVKGKVWFTWRADGGDWTPPTECREATVNWLANGKHVIEAAALDERLQIDPTPARAEVAIHVDARQQLAALIEQLNDPDYSLRNAAVAALVHQPTLALPLLRSAREKAGADQRWWIDAAIQQIEQKLAKQDKP